MPSGAEHMTTALSPWTTVTGLLGDSERVRGGGETKVCEEEWREGGGGRERERESVCVREREREREREEK